MCYSGIYRRRTLYYEVDFLLILVPRPFETFYIQSSHDYEGSNVKALVFCFAFSQRQSMLLSRTYGQGNNQRVLKRHYIEVAERRWKKWDVKEMDHAHSCTGAGFEGEHKPTAHLY